MSDRDRTPTNQGEAARDRRPDNELPKQGEQQCQAVGGAAEGKVPNTAPACDACPSPAIPPGRDEAHDFGPDAPYRTRETEHEHENCTTFTLIGPNDYELECISRENAGRRCFEKNLLAMGPEIIRERNELLAAKGNLERMERCVAAEQEWEILTAERDEAQRSLATHEAVWRDPAALHANLLRSPLCAEMRAKFLHLAGVDADIQQRAEKAEKDRFAEQSRADFLSGEIAKARREKAAFEQAWLSAEARANEQSLEAWRSQVNQDLAETTQRADLAEDEIERLTAQNAELVAALKEISSVYGSFHGATVVREAIAKIEGGKA